MNPLLLNTGVYQISKTIENPCHNKYYQFDWRYQKEFPAGTFYIIRRNCYKSIIEVNGEFIDDRYLTILVENGSKGPGTAGLMKFIFRVHTAHGDKPRISDFSIPEGYKPAPLGLLCALKPDHSAEALLSLLHCRNARQSAFSNADLLYTLAKMKKITAADIRDAIKTLVPKWDFNKSDEAEYWKF